MIVVTGAAGRLGRLVADRLVSDGQDVVGTDRVPADSPGFRFVLGDLSDADTASKVIRGADAVIHMGAIPGPRSAEPYKTFENNVRSTFNVMMAAAEHRVRRVVFSSSAFGMGWAHDPSAFVPLYLPLDEDHPMMPFEAYGLSKQIEVPVNEARRFIDGYFERYAGVKEYIDRTLEGTRERGFAETLWGRRRPIPDINSSNANFRGFAERAAVNTTVQGSAADIIKAAMIQIHRRLAEGGLKSRMILQVHDELVFEGPPREMKKLSALVKEEMEGAADLTLPLLVETHTGDNWDEAH